MGVNFENHSADQSYSSVSLAFSIYVGIYSAFFSLTTDSLLKVKTKFWGGSTLAPRKPQTINNCCKFVVHTHTTISLWMKIRQYIYIVLACCAQDRLLLHFCMHKTGQGRRPVFLSVTLPVNKNTIISLNQWFREFNDQYTLVIHI